MVHDHATDITSVIADVFEDEVIIVIALLQVHTYTYITLISPSCRQSEMVANSICFSGCDWCCFQCNWSDSLDCYGSSSG